MSEPTSPLIGLGVYSVAEVAALTGVAARTIRRWSTGYRVAAGNTPLRPPIWRRDLPDIDGQTALSFLDMMEVRFIRAFREHRVTWPAIREAARIACEMFQEPSHPFTRARFRTDGKRIFKQLEEEGHVRLFDLNRRSWVFAEIVTPLLYRGVEFEAEQVAKWFPLHPNRAILIDPAIAFGRPVTAREGVPTDTLAAAVAAHGGSIESVAKWYAVSVPSVRGAVEFERSFFDADAPATKAA